MHSRFYDTDLTNAAWARVAPQLCRRRDRAADRAPPTFVPSLAPSFTSCGQAAIGLLVANRVESADTSDRRAGAGLTWFVEERTARSQSRSFCAICKPIEFGHQCLVRLWPKVSNDPFLNAIPAFSCLRQYLHALLADLRGS
jgi:hypothetical protein